MKNPIVLEAVVVRCNENRYETRYDEECINAREAAIRAVPKDEEERREDVEAQFEAKRDALRRQHDAAAERQRLAAEAQRQREEAEYLMQFGELPPEEEIGGLEEGGNLPGATIPQADDETDTIFDLQYETDGTLPATEGGNAPIAETDPSDSPDDTANE